VRYRKPVPRPDPDCGTTAGIAHSDFLRLWVGMVILGLPTASGNVPNLNFPEGTIGFSGIRKSAPLYLTMVPEFKSRLEWYGFGIRGAGAIYRMRYDQKHALGITFSLYDSNCYLSTQPATSRGLSAGPTLEPPKLRPNAGVTMCSETDW